jgi:hypothetical protein
MNTATNKNNYFCIASSTELHKANLNKPSNSDKPVKIFHLFSPVYKDPDHELMRAQTVTLESMRVAATLTEIVEPNVSIEMAATALPEDIKAIPESFTKLDDLTLTSEEVAEFKNKRRLPLMYEILSRGRDAILGIGTEDHTYLIFTNVDIALAPHFYNYCAWLARRDYDFAVINRRAIEDYYGGVEDLAAMQSEIGGRHPGMDCFIIKADLLKYLEPTQAIVGMGAVERSLYYNMMAYTKKSVVIKNAHATFHIGLDSDWTGGAYKDYAAFNKEETVKLVSRLEASSPEVKERLEHFVRASGNVRQFPEGMLGITQEEKDSFKKNKWKSSRPARNQK